MLAASIGNGQLNPAQTMTKPRICVIGNSHAAAIRTGLDLMPALGAAAHFDFFAAQRDWMREMELQGDALVPTSEVTRDKIALHSGGMERIEARQYDHFLLVGLGSAFAGLGSCPRFQPLTNTRSPGLTDCERQRTHTFREHVLRRSQHRYCAIQRHFILPDYCAA